MKREPFLQTTYEVSYTFDVAGKTYSGTSEIIHRPDLKETVIYDPQNPRMNQIKWSLSRSENNISLVSIIYTTFLVLAVGFLTGWAKINRVTSPDAN